MKTETTQCGQGLPLPRFVLVWIAFRLHDACDWLHWIPGYRCQLVEWSWMLDAKFNLGIWIPIDDQNANSPFDLLMGQIEAMMDRARKYAEEDEAEENFEAAHRQRTVEKTLSELLRLGTHFKANTDRTEG